MDTICRQNICAVISAWLSFCVAAVSPPNGTASLWLYIIETSTKVVCTSARLELTDICTATWSCNQCSGGTKLSADAFRISTIHCGHHSGQMSYLTNNDCGCRSIVQFAYGEDGIDVMNVSYLKEFGFLSRNAERFAQQLNLQQALQATGLTTWEEEARALTRSVVTCKFAQIRCQESLVAGRSTLLEPITAVSDWLAHSLFSVLFGLAFAVFAFSCARHPLITTSCVTLRHLCYALHGLHCTSAPMLHQALAHFLMAA